MADERERVSGPIRRPARGPVVSTVGMELAGLAVCGVAALVGWPFGWLPDAGFVGVVTGVLAIAPAVDLYRGAAPPRRLALVAALLTVAAVRLLVTAAVVRAFPAAADQGIGVLVGYLVALPAGVAVLARCLGRAKGV